VTARIFALESANPFAASRVRSGMIPYQFPAGQSEAAIMERLRAAAWRGQVVGAHGSGKSTLLASLLPALSRHASEVIVVRLHREYRQLPPHIDGSVRHAAPPGTRRLIIIDGFEQLSLWQRLSLMRACRRHGHSLLVSSHRPLAWLPVIYRTQATQDTTWHVVRYLLREVPCPLTAEDIAKRLAARRGNVRELLFDLYDLYESRRRT
jgi:energy-coupling factor transporter ATP-binding protein EcfA2